MCFYCKNQFVNNIPITSTNQMALILNLISCEVKKNKKLNYLEVMTQFS